MDDTVAGPGDVDGGLGIGCRLPLQTGLRRLLAGVIGVPLFDDRLQLIDLRQQLAVLLDQMFQLLLRRRRAGQFQGVGRKLLFATVDVLGNDLGVVGAGIVLQVLLIMVYGRRRVFDFFFEEPRQLKMRGSGMRIDVERFLKSLHGAVKIHGFDAAGTEHEMRFLFLLLLALVAGQAASHPRNEKCGD